MLKKTDHIKRLAAILFAAFALTGCLKDNTGKPGPDDGKNKAGMTFDLLVPAMNDVVTRFTSLTDAQKNEIDHVHVFFFETGDSRQIIYHAKGTVISNNKAGLSQIYVQAEIPWDNFEVVMVANGSTMIDTAVSSAQLDATAAGRGEWFTKAELLKYLTVSHATGLWPAAWETPVQNVTMYGEAAADPQEIENGNVVKVPMTRMVAAVDFYMSDPDHLIYYFLLCNQPQSGMAYPNFADTRMPNMPSAYTRSNYEFGFGTHGTNSLVNHIYPFESPATDDSSIQSYMNESTCFILKIKWDGEYYYYRIDFTWDGSVPGTTQGEYMPILRNHRYIVDIKEVLGKGYATVEEAKMHKGVLTNLNYTIHVVEGVGYSNIVYNGEYFFAISTDKVNFTMEGGDVDLKIKTNYPYQWTATLGSEDSNAFKLAAGPAASASSWSNVSVSGSADLGTLAVRSLPTTVDRSGLITIKAGRLTAYVALHQSNMSAISLHIYDESGNEISDLKFIDKDTSARSLLIKWTPASVPLFISGASPVGSRGGFEFAEGGDNLSAITQLTSGAAILKIQPPVRNMSTETGTYITDYVFIVTYQNRSLASVIRFNQSIYGSVN